MSLLNISHYTLSSSLGLGRAAHLHALKKGASGLRKLQFDDCELDCWLGEVQGLSTPLPAEFAQWECRNQRLAWLSLQQDDFAEAVERTRARYGADRIGVFIGTSTAGIHHSELAYRARVNGALPDWFDYRHTQNLFSTADFVAHAFKLSGHALAISTACSSSAKVFAAASRAIRMGICDAAIVGGVDSLCLTTLYGFNSLQLVSSDVCRPADRARNGISIGEGAGFAILEHPDNAQSTFALRGYGESSDAHHMSSPDPAGSGAAAAMRAALRSATCEVASVDYINLHGTGTQANDAAEDKAVFDVFGSATPCSSTKGWTGHTLGAAGIVEAVISLLCIEHGLLPRSLQTRSKDPALQSNVLLETRPASVQTVMSNSFGFGGSNCCLLFGRNA